MAYACAVCVTIFSSGGKFRLVSNFMELHALTLAARPVSNFMELHALTLSAYSYELVS